MEKIRILIGKPGLDGHDRGAKIIARACKEAGMEVIYTGLHQSPEMIVQTALQEDVHAVGLSILSGSHNDLVPPIAKGLKKSGLKDCLLIVGGVIPDQDIKFLKDCGADLVFTPGTPMSEIILAIESKVESKFGLK